MVRGHDKIINCIDGCGGLDIGGGAPEIVTGSRDGTVRVWDPRQQDPVLSLEPIEGETQPLIQTGKWALRTKRAFVVIFSGALFVNSCLRLRRNTRRLLDRRIWK